MQIYDRYIDRQSVPLGLEMLEVQWIPLRLSEVRVYILSLIK